MNNKGQYFTSNKILCEGIFSLIKTNPDTILEPSVGRGDIVEFIKKKWNVKFDCYEINNTLDFKINKNEIVFKNFLETDIQKKYKCIIGNPPYIKTEKGNVYIDFIDKCIDILENKGELIFIIPSDFFKLTMSKKTIKKIFQYGTITDVIYPENEHLFQGATIDVLIFRFEKDNLKNNIVVYNGEKRKIKNFDNMIIFEKINKILRLEFKICNFFNVYVGIVSGRENIFKHKDGNIKVMNDFDTFNNYILINKYPSGINNIDIYMLNHKEELINRKIRKFTEKNWFEWGALRNIKIMEKYVNEDCIYIRNITRKKTIASKGRIVYFGGKLLMMKPKNKSNISLIVNILNTYEFYSNFLYSGRFKIGQRQLLNCVLYL